MDVISYLLGKKSGGGGSTLQNKNVTINENGTTNITADEGYDGLSEVEVTTDVNLDLSEYFEDTITFDSGGGWTKVLKTMPPLRVNSSDANKIASYFNEYPGKTLPKLLNIPSIVNVEKLCYGCSALTTIDLSYMTQKVKYINQTFKQCSNVTMIDVSNWDTSLNDRFYDSFTNCKSLIEIKCNFDCSSVTNFFYPFHNCTNLTTLGTFSNIGKAYQTSQSANYSDYKLDLSTCTSLTHDSLMNIINGLYDIASAGVQPQKLVLGATNLAKLSQAEIDTATNKGWVVS